MAKDMDRVDFQKGDVLLDQGAPQSKAFFIGDGIIKRERVVDDVSHQVI
jgi:CRP-like cAMP-binding protein